ncbi:hypothetical protein K9U39_10895 [Rhodoblastus acidophilus]|uniref:Holin n=1 Tax=Candidatus Rhodoblastus alkanivorans TaxID=2954117 RepID=A0ABS9Z8W1_9HYPH|nr:hypothetical protein [Candidatus Rhodoblastus alkanivorans]MCI4680161.1 hypothetical protein [Candidatus Rhodoblastus alkanivorans]MCI4684118.1 hypothetical protein [Candidatus Rhodoblastus alkanivorans]MDI4641438.1 hypothetical protein [Rhodoblastus acidophilus]
MDRDNTFASAIVSALVILLLGAVTALVVTRSAPLADWQVTYLNQLGGGVIAAFSTVVGYWVGSSRGSQSKDRTIAELTSHISARAPQ